MKKVKLEKVVIVDKDNNIMTEYNYDDLKELIGKSSAIDNGHTFYKIYQKLNPDKHVYYDFVKTIIEGDEDGNSKDE